MCACGQRMRQLRARLPHKLLQPTQPDMGKQPKRRRRWRLPQPLCRRTCMPWPLAWTWLLQQRRGALPPMRLRRWPHHHPARMRRRQAVPPPWPCLGHLQSPLVQVAVAVSKLGRANAARTQMQNKKEKKRQKKNNKKKNKTMNKKEKEKDKKNRRHNRTIPRLLWTPPPRSCVPTWARMHPRNGCAMRFGLCVTRSPASATTGTRG
mmetsp:Transcript_41550/g.124205  ORF Transcript_41550/g.124205 Transcript_41550/m.124205 type:complete len:207 (-) Transcript_41550:182-802(-)